MSETLWGERNRRHPIKRMPPPPLTSARIIGRSMRTAFNTVKRRVAHHSLERIIRLGHVVDKDFDIPVKCSEVYGGFWYNFLRDAVLERDRHRCRMCDHLGARDVHHVKPRWLGGIDHPFNLITLCTKCHKAEHKRKMCEKAMNDKDQTKLDIWIQDTGRGSLTMAR